MKSLLAALAVGTLIAGASAFAADNDPYGSTNKTPPGTSPSPTTDTNSSNASSGSSTGTAGTSATSEELPGSADSKKTDSSLSTKGSAPKQ